MSKNRLLLTKVLKAWAQDHDLNYQIADPDPTDNGVDATGAHLSWVIKNSNLNLDLLTLLDRLEFFMQNTSKRNQPDGMFCCKCQSFYDYAEPNQVDGTLICYSCRNRP